MAIPDPDHGLSRVEQIALRVSPTGIYYPPDEKIRTIVVEHFPALGKLAAMRFLEWAQDHPGGVISLPTGKSPEHFIKWVQQLLANWETRDAAAELEAAGVDPSRRPDMRSLHFVQIDEFYPINPSQYNSFYHYVDYFYINGFGLDRNRALLIDCSAIGIPPGETLATVWPNNEVDLGLRYRRASNLREAVQKAVLERIDEWCQMYEDRIRALGGIGFFLGGIGPDGHIGFNVRGSDHHSTTRLAPINYETQAAAAADLGGIEVARKRHVITIGLGTITYNPETVAIIIAAGAAKAEVVAAAIQHEKSVTVPATALHVLPNARFYVTRGAARDLVARHLEVVQRAPAMSDEEVERILVRLSATKRKRVVDLVRDDLIEDRCGAMVLERRQEPLLHLCRQVRESLITKIERGAHTLTHTRFLHTEPHHDDLLLGYLPFIVRHVRDASNTHHFVCLTSGFTAVTNSFMQQQLERLLEELETDEFAALLREGYFQPANAIGRNRDVWECLDGIAASSEYLVQRGCARRLLRNLIEVFEEDDLANIRNRIHELVHYFKTQYPGKRDPAYIQRLKGMCREFEAECLWGYFGWNCANVVHLRLGFYTGDIFTEEPTVERDVPPVLRTLEAARPDVVSVALDPEASGPDTHYKVLQAITEALRRYEQETGRSDIQVWGYRNVWYRFDPSEANVFVPVSLNMFAILHNAFMNAFLSQRNASFPSHEHDGPFCDLAQRIQVEQYQKIKICLGREWFYEHPSPLIRATRGLVFLRALSLPELYAFSRELKHSVENR